MRRNPSELTRLGAVIIAIGLAATPACTSLHRVPPPSERTKDLGVKVGDHVRVLTKNGEQWSFKLRAVDDEALIGRDIRISYPQIATLEVRQRKKGFWFLHWWHRGADAANASDGGPSTR